MNNGNSNGSDVSNDLANGKKGNFNEVGNGISGKAIKTANGVNEKANGSSNGVGCGVLHCWI